MRAYTFTTITIYNYITFANIPCQNGRSSVSTVSAITLLLIVANYANN